MSCASAYALEAKEPDHRRHCILRLSGAVRGWKAVPTLTGRRSSWFDRDPSMQDSYAGWMRLARTPEPSRTRRRETSTEDGEPGTRGYTRASSVLLERSRCCPRSAPSCG